jgi:DNA replication protein DnaC
MGHHYALLRRPHAPDQRRTGYLPLPGEAASALFQVAPQRYLKTSIVLTTNRGVASWGQILGDTTIAAAILDRLLHRSVVLDLDGDSYRLRAHHAW